MDIPIVTGSDQEESLGKELKPDRSDLGVTTISVDDDDEEEEDDDGGDDGDSKGREMLKEGPVSYLGQEHVLTLTSTGLKLTCSAQPSSWICRKRKFEGLDIPWKHVITAEMLSASQTRGTLTGRSFNVHYIEVCERQLRARCVQLTSVKEEGVDVWVDLIRGHCVNVAARPRSMLVVVNTFGGLGNGAEIYQKKIAPIFKLAEITTHVIYTERPKHPRDIGENEDWAPFDSVAVVGGDGTFQEVLLGMTIRRQKLAGVNHNEATSEFVCLDKPIGIIPTGSWNCLSGAINRGVKDVETATLRILTGEIHKSQIFTLHNNGKLFSIGGLSFTFGGVNQVSKRSEELRWMKKFRYIYAALTYLIKKKERMTLTLDYLVTPSKGDNSSNGCLDGGDQESPSELQWTRHNSRGRPYGNMMCSTLDVTDKQDSTMKNPFTSGTTLYVDLGCPTIRVFRLFAAVLYGNTNIEEEANVEVIKNIRGLRVKVHREKESQGDKNRVNSLSNAETGTPTCGVLVDMDGECLEFEVPEFEFRVLPSFVPLYASKIS